ncbi:MAG: lyase family protein [Gammaproteobacteria bacterium]|nr:lyase family protein [Gammaproteobacteria bacterium]
MPCSTIMPASSTPSSASTAPAAASARSCRHRCLWIADASPRLLGFDGILPNSLHGYSSLDLELAVLSSLAIFTANLARFAETLFLWASTDFGFLRFGSSFTGTSYAMPHKRNPYALRLARPAAARVAGALAETTQLFAGGLELVGNGVIHVPNRTIEAIDVVRDLCAVLAEAIPTIEVNRSRMHASAVGGMGSSPQLVFHLVEHHGIPYRQAHELTGRIVSRAMAEGISLVHLPAAVIEEVINDGQQPGHAIDTDALARALDPEAVVASRGGGGPSPESVATEIESMSTALLSIDAALDVHRERRRQGRERLARRVGAILESGRG